jgi:hypothetical protein
VGKRERKGEGEQGIGQAPGNRFYLTPDDDTSDVVSESRSGRSIRPRMLIARAGDVSELSRQVNGRSKETAIESTIASTSRRRGREAAGYGDALPD